MCLRSQSRGLVAPPEPHCRWSPRPLMRKLAAHRPSLPDSGFLHGVFSPSFFSSSRVSLRPSFCLCHRPISIRRLQADQVLRSGLINKSPLPQKVYVESNWTGSFFWEGARLQFLDDPLNEWKWNTRERCLFQAVWIGYGFISVIFLSLHIYLQDNKSVLFVLLSALSKNSSELYPKLQHACFLKRSRGPIF